MYFIFLVGGNDFESLINLGFSSVPILHSSISDLKGSILGFLGTSFKSNKLVRGLNPLGKELSLRLITSVSSLIISSISVCSKLSISNFVNLVGINLSISSPSISFIYISFLVSGSIDVSVSMLLLLNSSFEIKMLFIYLSSKNTCQLFKLS